MGYHEIFETMKEYDLKEMCRLSIVGFMALAVMGIVIFLSGCVTAKNTDHTIQEDYSDVLQQMQARMDSLLVNMEMQRKETSEKLSNLKVENKTVYLSIPDSTGKQYPTMISETNASKEEKENKTIETELKATIQRLIGEVSELKQKLETTISEKEKIKEMSWWDLYKMDVYAGVFALVIVGWIIYKSKKGG